MGQLKMYLIKISLYCFLYMMSMLFHDLFKFILTISKLLQERSFICRYDLFDS